MTNAQRATALIWWRLFLDGTRPDLTSGGVAAIAGITHAEMVEVMRAEADRRAGLIATPARPPLPANGRAAGHA